MFQAGVELQEFREGLGPLVAATLGNATGVGAILYYSMSSFMLPLESAFGWSRSEMGLAVSCLVLGWILTMPLLGMICDRIGPRTPILFSIPLLALSLASLSLLDGSLARLYVSFFLGAVLGSGTLGVTYIAAVTPYFDGNRGLAYGITLAGTGISAFLLPLSLHQVISMFDWQTAWLVLAAVVLIQWPIAFFCIKPRALPDTVDTEPAPDKAAGCTLSQALKSRSFWLLSGAFLVIAMLLSGLMINLIPLMRESGLTGAQAATATSGIGLGLVFARVFVGYLLDRIEARWVAVFAFSVAAVGCLLLGTDEVWLLTVAALALGFTVGSELDLLAYMTARYFGTSFHASIYAVALSIFYVGAVLAPWLVGELYKASQDYSLVLQASIGSCVLASLMILMVGPYGRTAERTVIG